MWDGTTLHCTPPVCPAGNYFRVNDASVLRGSQACTPCPVDTYLSGYTCVACPVNYGTAGLTARRSLSDCTCKTGVALLPMRGAAGGNASERCGACPTEAVYDAVSRSCRSCPQGMSAAPSATYCVCPGALWLSLWLLFRSTLRPHCDPTVAQL